MAGLVARERRTVDDGAARVMEMERDNRDEMSPKVEAAIRGAESFVVTGHVALDGDGAGSMMALYHGLTSLGKRVKPVANEPLSARYRFLDPHGHCMVFSAERSSGFIGPHDVLIVVDNNEWSRLGALERPFRESGRPVICLDHHVAPRRFSDLHLFNVDATSTGEVIHDLLERLGVHVDFDIAQALYTTLCTDSGWFRHSNTKRRTFELAAKFLAAGVSPERVSAEVNLQDTLASKRLLASFLGTLQVEFEGQWCFGAVTRAMLAETGCVSAEADGFVEQLRSIRGVKIVAFFKEVASGGIKVSLRSRDGFSALEVARVHGGGGHEKAAGVTMRTDLAHAVARIRAEIARQIAG